MSTSQTTREATKAADRADASQAHADALTRLLDLIDDDGKLSPLRGSYTVEHVTAERNDYEDDAEEQRTLALSLGYIPE